MARRTFSDYKNAVTHALGGTPASGVTTANMVNDAMKHLASMRSWNWLRDGEVRLSVTGPLSLDDGTWTESSKTLTSTGAFTSYTFANGDTIEITDGTGVTTGTYSIASRTDADNIVLNQSISTAGTDLATGDIAGTIRFPYVNLPADFGELVAMHYPGSFARNMVPTTLEQILWYRSNPITSVSFTYYYAINSGRGPISPQTSPDPMTGLSAPRIELYPAPDASVSDAIAIAYRRELKELGNDNDIPLVPEWLDYPLELLCRSFAMTLEDDNPNNSAQQMFERLWPTLVRRDCMTQSRRGPMKGGLHAVDTFVHPFYPESIGDPS